jgi:hypothetical protein
MNTPRTHWPVGGQLAWTEFGALVLVGFVPPTFEETPVGGEPAGPLAPPPPPEFAGPADWGEVGVAAPPVPELAGPGEEAPLELCTCGLEGAGAELGAGPLLDGAAEEAELAGVVESMIDETTEGVVLGGAVLDETTEGVVLGGAVLDETTEGVVLEGAVLDETTEGVVLGGAVLDETTEGVELAGGVSSLLSETTEGVEMGGTDLAMLDGATGVAIDSGPGFDGCSGGGAGLEGSTVGSRAGPGPIGSD